MDNRTIEEVRNNEDRLIDNIEKLEQQLKKKDEIIEKIKKKCSTEKGKYDYNMWLKLSKNWKELTYFTEKIEYNLHPIITTAYRCDLKRYINELIDITKNDTVLKKDLLDILKEVTNY